MHHQFIISSKLIHPLKSHLSYFVKKQKLWNEQKQFNGIKKKYYKYTGVNDDISIIFKKILIK
jgi:hypothetical protein